MATRSFPVWVGDDGQPVRLCQAQLRPGARLRPGDERRNRPPGAGRARELASQDGEELVAFARANPGRLTFGHAGVGTQTHLAAENFLYQAKADAVSVPYKGEAPALAGLVGGEISSP